MKLTTTKFEKFKTFLEALNYRCQQKNQEYLEFIHLSEMIFKIVEKRSKSKRVVPSEYEALAKEACPESFLLCAFAQSEEAYNTCDQFINNCPNITCDNCWKSCIDYVVNYFNENPVCVKNLDPSEQKKLKMLEEDIDEDDK